mmetsp:Transcript_27367/g.82112  ORF Transcript_27367/g.82112 Transcript_27367/m.82112 type:complete len:362 (-) Transcript_27367:58-1143(-)
MMLLALLCVAAAKRGLRRKISPFRPARGSDSGSGAAVGEKVVQLRDTSISACDEMTRAAALSALSCVSPQYVEARLPQTAKALPAAKKKKKLSVRSGSDGADDDVAALRHRAMMLGLRGGATAAELQDVLNLRGSDTACLLAVGAGPLKKVLAEAAEASQGTLLLKEIDPEAEAALVQALQAARLPTLYSLRDGRLMEAMVGMPKSMPDLATFIMKAMGGSEDPQVPASRTQALARIVGRASLGPAGREKLEQKVKEALKGAKDCDREAARTALNTLTQYLKHAYLGKPIFLDNPIFSAKIAPVPPAVEVLKVAGYVEIPGDPEAEEGSDERRDQLMPSHRNLAIFELTAATIDHALNRDL